MYFDTSKLHVCLPSVTLFQVLLDRGHTTYASFAARRMAEDANQLLEQLHDFL